MSLDKRNYFDKDKNSDAKRFNKLKKRFLERIHTLQRITVPTDKNFNSLLSGYWNLDKLPENFFAEFNGIAIEWVKLTKILKEKCESEEYIKLFHEKIPILTQCFACLIAKDKATLKFLQIGFKTWSFVLANVPKDILKSTVATNINEMSQIVKTLFQAGHYPTQMNGLEVLLKYLDFDETDRKYIIDLIIASDGFESIRLMLKGFDINNFDLECRKFLNHLNKKVSDELRVLSVRVLYAFMEHISIKHPIVKEEKLELWADFNSTNQTVSILCNCTTFGESDINYVVLIEADIKEITFNENAKVMTIRTKNPPKCDYSKFDTYLNDVTNITLYCDNNASYDQFCEFTKKLEIDIDNDEESVVTVLDTITDRGNITTSAFSLSSTPIKNFKNAKSIIQCSKVILPDIKNTCSKAANELQYENYLPPRRGSFTDNFSEPNANDGIEYNYIPPLNNCNEDSDLFNNSNFSSNIPPTQKFHVNSILTDQANCQANYENSHQNSLNATERSLNREKDPILNSSVKVTKKSEVNSNKNNKTDKKENELLTFTKLKPREVPLNIQIKNKTLKGTENINNGYISASYPRSATKRKLYDSPHDNIYLSAGSQDTTIQRQKYLDNKRKFEEKHKNSVKNLISKINVEQTNHSLLPTENLSTCHLDENEVEKRKLSLFNDQEKDNITENIKKINLTVDSSGRKFFKSEKTIPYVKSTENSIVKEAKNSRKFSYRRAQNVETETVISEKFTKPSSIRKPKKSANQQNLKSEKLPSIPTRARLERAKKPTKFKFSDSENESESDKFVNLNKKRKKNPCKTQNSKQVINCRRNTTESNNSKYVNLTDEKKKFIIPDKNAVSQLRVVNYEIESTISRNIDGKYQTREIFTKKCVTEIEEKKLYAIPEEPKWILEKYFNCLASEQQSSENLNEDDDLVSSLSNHDKSNTIVNNQKNEFNNENNEKLLSMDISPILSVNVQTSHKSDSLENVLNENISDIDIEMISNNNFENTLSEIGEHKSDSTFVIPAVPQKRKSNGHTDSISKKPKKVKDNQVKVYNSSNCTNETTNTENENRIFNTISAIYKLRMDNVANEICNELTNKYNFEELANQIGELIEEYVTYQERQQSIAEPLLAKIEKLTEELNKERKALYETLRESYQCTSKMYKDFGKLLKILDKNKANAYKSFHEYMKDISDLSKRNMQEIWNNHLDGAAKTINHIFENNLNF